MYVYPWWWCSASAWVRLWCTLCVKFFFGKSYLNVYECITYIFMCIHHDDAPRARGRVCTWTYHVYICTSIIMMLERVGMSWQQFECKRFMRVTWLIHLRHESFHLCDMTHPHVWHDLFTFLCIVWLIYQCEVIHSYVWHDSFIFVTWLTHMCDMTHSYVWHDSLIWVTWLIHMCDWVHSCVQDDSFTFDMPHSHMWLDAFICVTWLIYTRDVTAVEAGTCSGCRVTHMNQSCHTFGCVIVLSCVASVTWLIHVCDMTH